jgi:hypothetical protein
MVWLLSWNQFQKVLMDFMLNFVWVMVFVGMIVKNYLSEKHFDSSALRPFGRLRAGSSGQATQARQLRAG